MIYLDYSANYPTKNEVLEELVNVEKKYIGNLDTHVEIEIRTITAEKVIFVIRKEEKN